MKINETGRIGGINPYHRGLETRDQQIEKKKHKDQLSISVEAMEMLDAQKLKSDPVRKERIQQLRHEVSTGTYFVESDKIAEKLLPYFKSSNKSGE